MDERERARSTLTGNIGKRPNLGPAVKPSEGIRRIRDRLFGKLSDWLNVKRRDEVLASRRQHEARESIRESLTKSTGVFGKIKTAFGGFFGKAAAKLGEVTAKLLGADNPLWKEPVAELRKRPSAEMKAETAGGTPMIGVNSTNVFSVGWDAYEDNPRLGEMTIQFRRESRVYEYDDAPEWLYRGLLSSESPGRYVWAFVRALYDNTSKYRRIA